jgi:hypothetical protein
MVKIKILRRPGKNKKIVEKIVKIINTMTGKWFTANVAENVVYDLYYQDLILLFDKREIQSFILFTCIDGSIQIMLMATRIDKHNMGYGKRLYEWFEKYIKQRGFNSIIVQTVPDDVNENYKGTINFYNKRGFKFKKRYNELWEHGAIELEKKLI